LAIVCWASVRTLCLFDHDNCTAGWVGILRKVLLATLPVTSVILAKSVLMQIKKSKSPSWLELALRRDENRTSISFPHSFSPLSASGTVLWSLNR